MTPNRNRFSDQNPAYLNRKRSQQILNAQKKRLFLGIFKMLRPNSQGYISAGRIDVQSIDKETLAILAPLLFEIEELGERLDFE